jgi:hypothetical protein
MRSISRVRPLLDSRTSSRELLHPQAMPLGCSWRCTSTSYQASGQVLLLAQLTSEQLGGVRVGLEERAPGPQLRGGDDVDGRQGRRRGAHGGQATAAGVPLQRATVRVPAHRTVPAPGVRLSRADPVVTAGLRLAGRAPVDVAGLLAEPSTSIGVRSAGTAPARPCTHSAPPVHRARSCGPPRRGWRAAARPAVASSSRRVARVDRADGRRGCSRAGTARRSGRRCRCRRRPAGRAAPRRSCGRPGRAR